LSTTLSDAAVNRVHSYLAIKYGITLPTDYIASSNTTVFSTAAPYNNNIIGIARDDASGLLQKQSHNDDDSVRIYAGTLATTNAANGTAFSVDQSFVMAGANTGQLNATVASNAVKPAGIYSRLEREWEVTKTNYAQTFSMDIKLSPHANPLSVLTSDLRLLVDNTGNFANATVYAAGGGLTFSYNYPVITVSGISNTQIPNNSTWNITIASVSVMTTLPVDLVSFTGACNTNSIALQWATATETGTNYFIVERSSDGAHYTAVAQLSGNSNSTTARQYSYTDKGLSEGTYYYRLKITDLKNEGKYSSTIGVKQDCMTGGTTSLVVYPNPVKDNRVQLDYTAAKDEMMVVRFENTLGQTCLTQPVQFQTGKNTKTIAVDNLSPGIYFMRVESSQQKSKVVKLVISKGF
jgi:hypothetical protein